VPRQLDAYAVGSLVALPLPASDLCIDLTQTTFVTPAGMTVLFWIIRQLREAGCRVHVEIGSKDVANYLCRMNFHLPFSGDVDLTFNPDISAAKIHKADASSSLMEFRLIAVNDSGDVESAALHLLEIVASQAPGLIRDRDEFFTSIAEMVSNVERHSGVKEASIVAQTVKDRVRVAVGDNGCGIRRSLAVLRANQIQHMPDHAVNLLATEPGVTGSPFGGGYGLTTLRDLVAARGQALHIISGQGRATILKSSSDGSPLQFMTLGTVVELSLQR